MKLQDLLDYALDNELYEDACSIRDRIAIGCTEASMDLYPDSKLIPLIDPPMTPQGPKECHMRSRMINDAVKKHKERQREFFDELQDRFRGHVEGELWKRLQRRPDTKAFSSKELCMGLECITFDAEMIAEYRFRKKLILRVLYTEMGVIIK